MSLQLKENVELYATWFRCLGDPSRLLILNRLAIERRPMTVGEIVQFVGVGQSTVSEHLRRLAEAGFVRVAHEGSKSYFSINERCIECFPPVAELVMGKTPTDAELPVPAPGATSRRKAMRMRSEVGVAR